MRDSVVRAGCSLRMVLHTENGQAAMAEPFHGAIVQVHMRHFELARSFDTGFIPLDGESVILRSDEDSARGHLAHGVVSTPVTERQLDGRTAKSETQDLVAEADSENRCSARGKLADRLRRVCDRVGITRPV